MSLSRFYLFVTLLLCCPILKATEYHGSVGQHPATFSLNWKSDGNISGSYFFSVQKDQVRTLVGSNYEEGKLYLEEYSGQNLVAKCYLQKTLTNGDVVWQGEMQTADGRYPMRFSRQRKSNAPAGTPVPSSTTPEELTDEQFASRIKTEVVWSKFPHADQVAAVPFSFDSARHMRAKVENCQSTADHLTLVFRIGLSESGDWSKVHFTGPQVTFRINRHIPIPKDEIVGDEISLQFDPKGEIIAINLLGIGVTHVRKSSASEKLEVQALVENDDLFALFDENASEQDRRNAIERATSFSFLPDKLALLNEDSKELMFFRVLQLVKDYGVIIQTMDTGPGMLELESLTLEAPPEPNPWVPVGEWSKWGPVPGVQRGEG